jgi:CBS domain-containing protein
MRCRDVMNAPVAVCTELLSVQACAEIMRDENLGFMPVLDAAQEVVGVVTDRDLAVRVLAEGLPPTALVGEVMTRDVRICHPGDGLQVAERKMASTMKSRLVVVDADGRCVGVLSLTDIAQADSRSRAGTVLRAVTRRESVPFALP